MRKASEILSRAFYDDPVSIFISPDPVKREKYTKFGFQTIACYGVRYAEAYASSPNLEAIAIWVHFEKFKVPLWHFIKCVRFRSIFSIGIKTLKRLLLVESCTSEAHRFFTPGEHWYLNVIGTDPEFQGKGYGSDIIREQLKKIDEDRLPVYLETNKERNVSFYQKFGFKVMKEHIVPKTDLKVWFMLRQ